MYREQAPGYRAIKRELKKIGIDVSWQTVRRLIKERLDENLEYRVTNQNVKMPRKGEPISICRYKLHSCHDKTTGFANEDGHCTLSQVHPKPLPALHQFIDHNPAK